MKANSGVRRRKGHLHVRWSWTWPSPTEELLNRPPSTSYKGDPPLSGTAGVPSYERALSQRALLPVVVAVSAT